MAVVVAVVGLLAPGCSGGGPDDEAVVWTETPSLPCPRVEQQSPASAPGADYLADLAVGMKLGAVKLWGHYLSYSTGDRVVVCDLESGRTAVLAQRPEGTATLFDYVVGSGDRVVFTRLSKLPSVTEKVDWAIETVDPATGARRTVAETKAATPELAPRPAIEGPWLAWTQEGSGGVSVETLDLRSGRRRTVAPASTRAGNVGVTTDGRVVFDGSSGPGRERDVFVVPAAGGEIHKLTNQGAVQPLVVANGRATWRNGSDGPVEPERWTTALGEGETPVRVMSTGRAVPGPDFLVTEEGEGLMVHGLRPGDPPMPLVHPGERLDLGALWDVRGELVVWVTVDYPPTTPLRRHLRMARVRR